MIFDCFTFFNELNILEIRLNELTEVVDWFVLVEATKTFQGQDKPLYYLENKNLFEEFNDKIIHIVVEFPERIDNEYGRTKSLAWGREQYQRDQIARGLNAAKSDDLVIISK